MNDKDVKLILAVDKALLSAEEALEQAQSKVGKAADKVRLARAGFSEKTHPSKIAASIGHIGESSGHIGSAILSFKEAHARLSKIRAEFPMPTPEDGGGK